MKIKSLLLILPFFLLLFYMGCESNDAVTSSVYIPQPVNKKVLVEFFTNSYCLPCVNAHNYWDQVKAVGGLTLNDTSVIVVSIHARSPNQADSIYRGNRVQNDDRYNYYGVQTTPNNQLDGVYMGEFSSTNFSALLNTEFLTPKYLDITLSNFFDGTDSGTVTANFKALSTLPTGDNVVHVAITENNVAYVTAVNGVTHPSDVERFWPTGSGGQSINLPVNQAITFAQNYRLASNWKKQDCYLTVYVQSTSTRQVYGVERIKISN